MPADYSFKICLLGDGGTGKSSLLERLLLDESSTPTQQQPQPLSGVSKPTVGVDFFTTRCRLPNDKDHEGKTVVLHIWDTAGQERFQSITQAYLHGISGALVVFDVTRSDTFMHVTKWLTLAMEQGGVSGSNVVLIGNKCDLRLQRQVKDVDAMSFVQKSGVGSYLETSAVESTNVRHAFDLLALRLVDNLRTSPIVLAASQVRRKPPIKLPEQTSQSPPQQQATSGRRPCC